MSTRTGLDLQPEQCRVVDVQLRSAGSPPSSDRRVRTFATLTVGFDSPQLAVELRRIRQERGLTRQAWVTLWGLRSVHQFLRLPPTNEEDLEALVLREAWRELAPLESDSGRPSVALMVGADVQVGTHRRREVALVAASAEEITRCLRPVVDAGFDVQGVSTPAMALTSLSCEQRGLVPGVIRAYVALEAQAMCVAIVRDGVLLLSRELPWGYADSQEPVDLRLVAELRRSILFFRQTFRKPVEQVVLCGGAANLRTLTSQVGSAVGIPVETLDSLSGVDAEAIPEPAETFRSIVASLRLAMAPAAEPDVRFSLLPATFRVGRKRRSEAIRIAVAFAAAALLVSVWYGLARRSGSDTSEAIEATARRVAMLEPDVERVSALRRGHAISASQQAALSAFDSQGPRLARLLESLSRTTPEEVVLNEVAARAEGPDWRTALSGLVLTTDPAAGRSAVTGFLQQLAESPFVGPTTEPPAFHAISRRGRLEGVEFSALVRVRK